MASITADQATPAALSLRDLGKAHAAESRAQAGLATPAEDVTQLRRLVAILDYVPDDGWTARRRRRTAPANRSRGTSRGAT